VKMVIVQSSIQVSFPNCPSPSRLLLAHLLLPQSSASIVQAEENLESPAAHGFFLGGDKVRRSGRDERGVIQGTALVW